MALTPEMKSLIEKKAAEVRKIRRSGLSHYNYLDDYGSLIANLEKNLAKIVQAGLDETQLPYYRGCLELLAKMISDGSGNDPESEEKAVEYALLVNIIAEFRLELGVVGRFIAKNSKNRKVKQKYKQIAKGSGDIDNAIDILGLVAMVKKYPSLAARIRPEGKVIDDAYCEEASEKAIALLQMKGFVIVNGVLQNSGSDFVNRIITLCLENQAEIKEFTKAAFCKDPDYYNANFTSKYRKTSSGDSDDLDDDDDSETDDQQEVNTSTETVTETATVK